MQLASISWSCGPQANCFTAFLCAWLDPLRRRYFCSQKVYRESVQESAPSLKLTVARDASVRDVVAKAMAHWRLDGPSLPLCVETRNADGNPHREDLAADSKVSNPACYDPDRSVLVLRDCEPPPTRVTVHLAGREAPAEVVVGRRSRDAVVRSALRQMKPDEPATAASRWLLYARLVSGAQEVVSNADLVRVLGTEACEFELHLPDPKCGGKRGKKRARS